MTPQLKQKIEATRVDWEQAEDRFRALPKNHYLPRDYMKLNNRQVGMISALRENIKSMNGEAVMVFCNADGVPYGVNPYRGMVLNAREYETGKYTLRVLLHPSDHDDWTGERLEDIFLYQLEQVRDVHVASQDDLRKMRFLQIIDTINRSRKSHITVMEKQKADYQYQIQSLRKEVVRYENQLKAVDIKLKTNNIVDLTGDQVMDFFRQLGKHKKVANAYLDMAGRMVVETRMLYTISPVLLKENKRRPIGRFVMRLSTEGIRNCEFANLDYCYNSGGSHYPHPNIMNKQLCHGDNGADLDAMARSGSFYELTDFLILFLSMFPQDSGGPHVPHDVWIRSRKPEPKTNPFYTPDRMWELRPVKDPVVQVQPTEKKKEGIHDILANGMAGRSEYDQLVHFAGGDGGNRRQRIEVSPFHGGLTLNDTITVPAPPREEHEIGNQRQAAMQEMITRDVAARQTRAEQRDYVNALRERFPNVDELLSDELRAAIEMDAAEETRREDE
jgi:hypothetical protein